MILALDTSSPRKRMASGYKRGQQRVRLVCSACGHEFERYKSAVRGRERNYCSPACQRADRSGDHNPKWRGGRCTIACAQCGQKFEAARDEVAHGRARFCSIDCKAASQRRYPNRRVAHREHGRRRETRKRAGRVIATHTFAEWEAVLAAAKGRCAICRKRRKLERDHIIPLSKGGSDAITNIQPVCKSCNCRKHNRRTHLL